MVGQGEERPRRSAACPAPAGEREGGREGGTEDGRGSQAAAGGAIEVDLGCGKPPGPTPRFCSRELRVLARSRGAGLWVGSRAWCGAQDPAPSHPTSGCRGRWGTSAAPDARPGRGLPARGARDDSGFLGLARRELEGTRDFAF